MDFHRHQVLDGSAERLPYPAIEFLFVLSEDKPLIHPIGQKRLEVFDLLVIDSPVEL